MGHARAARSHEPDLKPPDHNSIYYVHALTEISKWLNSQGGEYVDPETGEPHLDQLLSEELWASKAAKIDFSQASPYQPPVAFDSARSCSPTNYTLPTDIQQHTTHFVVADREGNMVSSTQTLGNVFGSKVMPEGTGIWLNDEVAWSNFEPMGST